jgi:DNA polymerase-3 subunit alpha/error-prone DNA polymerase
MGVFYIESPAMRQLQQKTGKGDFDHIVIHSSIIRPAANKFINTYVRRLKGEPWEPLHPRLKRILDETYGILCYQEDVSKTAIALAGFNEGEADALRKIIAKKAGGEKLSAYERKFREGCSNLGVAPDTVDQVWTMMCSFDGYSFCKPHSASYAMVSFQSAYLRVHHPAPFMAAVLSNQGGYYRAQAYVSEARRMGLVINGPDVNESSWRYEGRGATITVGFMAIAHLQKSTADAIVEERASHGLYASPTDLARRIRLVREDAVALAASGACDSLDPQCRRDVIARNLLSTMAISEHSGQQSEHRRLFEPEAATVYHGTHTHPHDMAVTASSTLSPTARHTDAELAREFEFLGFLRSQHPLALFIRKTASIRRIRACELHKHTGCHVTLIGWPVTSKAVWTSDGRDMQFVSFEDETALYETILFPDVHDAYNRMLGSNRPLVVNGVVRNDQGALHVEITTLQDLPSAVPREPKAYGHSEHVLGSSIRSSIR